jgi:hypothetical protein
MATLSRVCDSRNATRLSTTHPVPRAPLWRHARCPTFVVYHCAVYSTDWSNVRTKPEFSR